MSLNSVQVELLVNLLSELQSQDNTADISSMASSLTALLATDAMSSATNDPEHLTITVSGSTVGNDNFTTYTADTIQDVIVQNLSSSVNAYVTWDSTEAPTATSNMTYLPAKSTLSLTDVNYIYFSTLSADGSEVSIRVTGIG